TGWLQVGQGGNQRRRLRAPLLLGGAVDPLACAPTEARGVQDRRDLPPRTGGELPGVKLLAQRPYPTAVADCGHYLVAATEQPVEDSRGAKAPIEAEHDSLAAGPGPGQLSPPPPPPP